MNSSENEDEDRNSSSSPNWKRREYDSNPYQAVLSVQDALSKKKRTSITKDNEKRHKRDRKREELRNDNNQKKYRSDPSGTISVTENEIQQIIYDTIKPLIEELSKLAQKIYVLEGQHFDELEPGEVRD